MNSCAPVKSAMRVLDLLEMLAGTTEQLGVSEVSRQLGIPKSSAFMLLGTLEARGYVVGNEDRRFRLNPLLQGPSWIGGSHVALVRAAKPVMDSLAQATGESSFLAVQRDAATVQYIAKVVSQHEVRCDAELRQARPLHSTSVGLVLLAFQPEGATERFLERAKLEPLTPRTIVDPAQLRKELAAVRQRGYSIARDTNSPGASGIAAPIHDSSGRVVAALNLSAPTGRFEPVIERATQDLLRAASALSRELAQPVREATAQAAAATTTTPRKVPA